jgi:hypothetical protein
MHMAIGSALTMFSNRLVPFFTEGKPLSGTETNEDLGDGKLAELAERAGRVEQ